VIRAGAVDAVKELRGGDRRDAHLLTGAEGILELTTRSFQRGGSWQPAEHTLDLDEDRGV
jgi:hypothetical protein